MTDSVWDASVLLALLNRERGGEGLEDRMSGAAISAINLSEVAAKLVERGMPVDEVRDLLGALPLSVHPFDKEQAFRAAALRRETRSAGLSLGDRACLALGQSLACPVLTADRVWKGLDTKIVVEVVR